MYTTNPVTVYTVAYNEEKIIPYFIRHYTQIANKIVIFDNMSTDNTREVAREEVLKQKKEGREIELEIRSFESGESINDDIHVIIKQECWKDCMTEWCVVVDADELLYHPNIDIILNNMDDKHVFTPTGFDMICEEWPSENCLITDEVKRGAYSPNYSKPVLWKPGEVEIAKFALGQHRGSFSDFDDKVMHQYTDPDLKLLHYKNVTFDYRYNKNKCFGDRLSDFNKNVGAGVHYNYDLETQQKEFVDLLERSDIII